MGSFLKSYWVVCEVTSFHLSYDICSSHECANTDSLSNFFGFSLKPWFLAGKPAYTPTARSGIFEVYVLHVYSIIYMDIDIDTRLIS